MQFFFSMSTVGSLKPFDPTTDDVEIWIRAFKSFLIANEMNPREPTTKSTAEDLAEYNRCRAVLLSCVGLSAVATLTSLLSPTLPEEKPLQELLTTLVSHYKPSPKALAERFRFTSRKQQHGETVNQYLAELRRLASTCKFESELSNRLRDQFIFGLRSESTQKQIFTKPDDVKLEEVVNLAVAQELSDTSMSLVRGSSHYSKKEPEVQKVQKNQWKKGKDSKKNHGQQQSQSDSKQVCPNCGSASHKKAECPHTDVKCYGCGGIGHFKNMCRKSKKNENGNQHKSSKPSSSQARNVSVNTAEVHKSDQNKKDEKIWIAIVINNKEHVMEYDTGCEQSLLSASFYHDVLGSPPLKKCKTTFKTYLNQLFKPLGKLKCKLQYNGQHINHFFPVVESESLFGRDLMRAFTIDWSDVAAQCNSVESPDSLNGFWRSSKMCLVNPRAVSPTSKRELY